MFGLFGKKQQRSTEQQHSNSKAPGKEGIRYNPNLIADLKSDHASLFDLFTQVKACAAKRDARAIASHLENIHSALLEHLLKENVFFYVYLKNQLPANSSMLDRAQTFAREMPKIGSVVTDFLTRYSATPRWDQPVWVAFENELSAIITALSQRIGAEEDALYPLYLSPEEYLLTSLDPS